MILFYKMIFASAAARRTPLLLPSLVSFLLFLCGSITFSVNGLIITTPQGLIDFSNKVNGGNSYSGVTVYLGSDIDFTSGLSSQFVPIGAKVNNYFNGTFDGQGHAIRNLSFKTTYQYVGLFGYSQGAIIKNVVMGGSCSIVDTYSSDYSTYIGSISGRCHSCIVENIVNMGSITFTGKVDYNLFIGGITGETIFSGIIRNCANYGHVLHMGTAKTVYFGGVTGACTGTSGNKYIQNCVNYGTLTHKGTASANLYMGGIIGYSYPEIAYVENCVSGGKIANITSASSSYNIIGSIAGHTGNSAEVTIINHCLWTDDAGYNNVYGLGNATPTNSSLAELNTTTMNELNAYTEKNISWSKWFMLHLNGGIINSDISQETLIVTQKHFPDPVKEGRTFSFWCTDVEYTEIYYPNSTDIIGITNLYAVWDVNTVMFNFGNGTKTEKDVAYEEKYGDLPNVDEKEGYTFAGWFTEENGKGKRISSETIVEGAYNTLYAYWTINNYTLTFIFNNGESDEVRILNYSDPIKYPNDPVREGYTFICWDNKDATTMPAHNLNITGQWTVKVYTGFVEIVFVKKDMKKEEIKEIINRYTNEDFIIEKFETDEKTGEIRVIIKFIDDYRARKFIRNVNENKIEGHFIKRVSIVSTNSPSSSRASYPLVLSLLVL